MGPLDAPSPWGYPAQLAFGTLPIAPGFISFHSQFSSTHPIKIMNAGLDWMDALTEFNPKMINRQLMAQLFTNAPDSVKNHGRKLLADGWRFYVTNQKRGYCWAKHKIITVPAFAAERSLEYKIYYLCHEMAHAFDMCKHQHGPEFMEWFKTVCPPNLWHHEIDYKPRNAKAAGISKDSATFNEQLGF